MLCLQNSGFPLPWKGKQRQAVHPKQNPANYTGPYLDTHAHNLSHCSHPKLRQHPRKPQSDMTWYDCICLEISPTIINSIDDEISTGGNHRLFASGWNQISNINDGDDSLISIIYRYEVMLHLPFSSCILNRPLAVKPYLPQPTSNQALASS